MTFAEYTIAHPLWYLIPVLNTNQFTENTWRIMRLSGINDDSSRKFVNAVKIDGIQFSCTWINDVDGFYPAEFHDKEQAEQHIRDTNGIIKFEDYQIKLQHTDEFEVVPISVAIPV